MTQERILKYLKQNLGKKFSTKELSNNLDIGYPSIAKGVRKLKQYRLINFEYVKIPHTTSKGTNLYWINGDVI